SLRVSAPDCGLLPVVSLVDALGRGALGGPSAPCRNRHFARGIRRRDRAAVSDDGPRAGSGEGVAGDPPPLDLPVRAVLFRRVYRVLVLVSHGRRVLRHATALPAARDTGRLRGGAHPSQRVLAGCPIAVAGDEGGGGAGGAGGPGRPGH